MVRFTLFILILIGILISCSNESPTESTKDFFDIQGENGFVGAVEGTNAFVAILAGEAVAVAYVCNGDEKISEWFKGDVVQSTTIDMTNADGANLSARFSKDSFTGTVTLSSGATHSFRATPGTGHAGVYRVMSDDAVSDQVDAGWVLLSSGEERGALQVQSTFQATPALPQTEPAASSSSYAVFRFKIEPPGPVPPVPIPYPHFPLPTETTKPKG